MAKKNTILFVRPDYHCSFFYRDQMRGLGWDADIYVQKDYPTSLLYSTKGILRAPQLNRQNSRWANLIDDVLLFFWWLTVFWRYEYHVYYGGPPVCNIREKKLGLTKIFGHDFVLELSLAKYFGIKLIYLPTGCNDHESKEYFTKLDQGNVCGNCGFWHKCSDEFNLLNFARIRRYFDLNITGEPCKTSQYKDTCLKWKSIDLSLWAPNISIPSEHLLAPTDNVRILHGHKIGLNRNWKNRNIKGSPFIVSAVERLQSEGLPVQLVSVTDIPSNQMRYYQAQVDIIVEQLIYGWWGSSGVETMALGKPVVCYLRPKWKEFFLKIFPEYDQIPVVEADTNTIYEVLKKLVTNVDYRRRKGIESRRFAELHFDPSKNIPEFVEKLEAL